MGYMQRIRAHTKDDLIQCGQISGKYLHVLFCGVMPLLKLVLCAANQVVKESMLLVMNLMRKHPDTEKRRLLPRIKCRMP